MALKTLMGCQRTRLQQNSSEVPVFTSPTEAQVLFSVLRAAAAKHLTSHCPKGVGWRKGDVYQRQKEPLK